MRVPLYREIAALMCLGLGGLMTLSGCNQTSGYVMNESGKAYYAQGNYLAARREFERALMDSPENANYAFNVASAMRKQGDLIGAERMYERALVLDPRHQPAHHELAALLREQGRHEEAESHIEEWAATQPYVAEAHVERAWMQRERGDLAAAEQSLQRALRQKPHHARAMAHLGQVYHETGRPQHARALYQRSLALNPFQPEVRSRVAGMSMAMPSGHPYLAAYPPAGGMAPMMSSMPHTMASAGPSPMHSASYAQSHSGASSWLLNGAYPPGSPVELSSVPGTSPIQQAGYVQPALGGGYAVTPAGGTAVPGGFPATGATQYPLTMSSTPIVSPF